MIGRYTTYLDGLQAKVNALRRIVAYLDSVPARLASHKGMISLREVQSQTGDELRRRRTLLPSILDNMFQENCEHLPGFPYGNEDVWKRSVRLQIKSSILY